MEIRFKSEIECGVNLAVVYTLSYINKRVGVCGKALRFSVLLTQRGLTLCPAAWLGSAPAGADRSWRKVVEGVQTKAKEQAKNGSVGNRGLLRELPTGPLLCGTSLH